MYADPALFSDVPPAALSPGDARRQDHSRKRRRLIYSQYESDLDALMRRALGNMRAEAWRPLDLTANPYLAIWSQVAALYAVAPLATAQPGAEGLLGAVAAGGLWPLMQRVQRDTLAFREMLIRVSASPAGELTYRPVFPDLVEAWSDPSTPGVPYRVREAVASPRYGWEIHDLDLSGPSYRVTSRDGQDITEAVLGGNFDGAAYPYRLADGTPILPYTLYHAAETGCLWDAYTMREVVEGSLMLGVYLTFYGHILRHASWPQRYIVGASPMGAEVVDGDGGESAVARREVTADPAVVIEMAPDPNFSGQPIIGQWTTSADPEAVLRSIAMYERRVLTLAGVTAPDVTRTDSDIRSGYSLAVSRESIREAQRAFEPQFRRGDLSTLALSAALLNRATGSSYPESPDAYRIAYRGLPRSPQEMAAQLADLTARQAAGMIGPISAYMELHPDASRADAVIALTLAATERAEVAEIRAATAVAMGEPQIPTGASPQ